MYRYLDIANGQSYDIRIIVHYKCVKSSLEAIVPNAYEPSANDFLKFPFISVYVSNTGLLCK